MGPTSTGGANTTAVAESVVDTDGAVDGMTEAPTGILGADGFAFWAGPRRTGAKASAADQPFGRIRWMPCRCFNKRALRLQSGTDKRNTSCGLS